MRWSRAVLVLTAYALLDFANPLMPGAVQMVGAAVQVVDADRQRAGAAEIPPVALPAASPDPDVRPPAAPAPARRVVPRRRIVRAGTLRRPAGCPPADLDPD